MSDQSDLSGGQQAVATAADSAGKEFQVDITKGITAPGVGHTPQEKKPEDKTATTPKKEEVVVTQPSEKDERHFAQKVQQDFDAKVRLAKRLFEKDPESILELADEDESVANAVLRDSPYEGAKSVEQLRKVKEENLSDDERKFIKRDRKLSRLEQQLLDERILRLRGKNPDLQGDLETKFRELYGDERFESLVDDPEKLIGVARALTGTAPAQNTANDVAIGLLKQQEGSMPASGGSAPEKAKSKLTDSQRRQMKSFGHTEADYEKYLPKEIDHMLGAA